MARIFISYRRADSQLWSDRMYPILVKAFGKDNVFKDVDSIGLSRNFRAAIERAIISSDVVLILIGRQWVSITDDSGRKRLDNPDDFVRLEAEMALRHDKMVIPVTVDGARMPATTELPSALQDIPFLNGAGVRGDPDFDHDMRRLIRNIQKLTGGVPASVPRPPVPTSQTIPTALWLGTGLLFLLAVAVAAFVILPRLGSLQATITPTNEIAAAPSETLTDVPTLTEMPSPTETATADTGATEAAKIQATLTQLAIQVQDAKLTATADVSSRLATSQVEVTPDAAAGAATAVAIEITQAVLAETATQQALFATATRQSADVAGTQAVRDVTAAADARIDTPAPTFPLSPETTPDVTQEVAPATTPEVTLEVLLGLTPITRNADWTPLEQDFDGVTMVLVPAGCFDMGSNAGSGDEQPIHKQCFDAPFWIDKYEVKQSDFARMSGSKANANGFTGDSRPVESITWFEARAFCEDSRQARLLTEREWEYAARGPDNLVYPWGNAWEENNAVWSGNSNSQTADVGSRPAGISWVGALDMSGNVWEWVSTIHTDYPYDAADGREALTRTDVLRGLRGGSWDLTDTANLRTTDRNGGNPDVVYYRRGFRCARDYQ